MKIHTLTSAQTLPITREEAWAFFSDPKQLGNITPDDMGFELKSDNIDRMYAGMILRYRIKPFPAMKLKWVTEITHVMEGEKFVDEQRFGPFRFWHHQHSFTDTDGGVEMRDIVHYAMPLGIVGETVHKLLVRKRLVEIFEFRKEQIKMYFSNK